MHIIEIKNLLKLLVIVQKKKIIRHYLTEWKKLDNRFHESEIVDHRAQTNTKNWTFHFFCKKSIFNFSIQLALLFPSFLTQFLNFYHLISDFAKFAWNYWQFQSGFTETTMKLKKLSGSEKFYTFCFCIFGIKIANSTVS